MAADRYCCDGLCGFDQSRCPLTRRYFRSTEEAYPQDGADPFILPPKTPTSWMSKVLKTLAVLIGAATVLMLLAGPSK
jgi:hypothetical protein